MPQKIIHAFRHAQAEHNVADDYSIPDSVLTPLGRTQAAGIPSTPMGAHANSSASLLVTSPLRRTLQTTLLGFQPFITSHPPTSLILLPQLQEANAFECDIGTPVEVLSEMEEFKGKGLDFGLCVEGWNVKKGVYDVDVETLKERARWVRRWLRAREEEVIVVVAHAAFLRYLTIGEEDNSEWNNTEARSFIFEQGDESKDLEATFKRIEVKL